MSSTSFCLTPAPSFPRIVCFSLLLKLISLASVFGQMIDVAIPFQTKTSPDWICSNAETRKNGTEALFFESKSGSYVLFPAERLSLQVAGFAAKRKIKEKDHFTIEVKTAKGTIRFAESDCKKQPTPFASTNRVAAPSDADSFMATSPPDRPLAPILFRTVMRLKDLKEYKEAPVLQRLLASAIVPALCLTTQCYSNKLEIKSLSDCEYYDVIDYQALRKKTKGRYVCH